VLKTLLIFKLSFLKYIKNIQFFINMKNLYLRNVIKLIFEHNPVVFIITNTEKNLIVSGNINDIKIKKFKNILLQEYNKNIFNGVTYLVYGKAIHQTILDLKLNISGVFITTPRKQTYIFSFNKYNKLLKYSHSLLILPLLDILEGNIFWFLSKF